MKVTLPMKNMINAALEGFPGPNSPKLSILPVPKTSKKPKIDIFISKKTPNRYFYQIGNNHSPGRIIMQKKEIRYGNTV